ncbi:prominin-1-A-like [Protopterus annectens]|uniref:prominin-1-A-like n=1 Tax=Protopterus annectens TaxID=7888 RepID=UPI001CF9C157|nr:prominin-1-A-like [Protopterus annectens]
MPTLSWHGTSALLLGLLLLFISIISAKNCGGNEYQAISEPSYNAIPSTNLGGIEVLNEMVHVFLAVVQPKPFPADLVTKAIKDVSALNEPENYKQVIIYEVGFLVCGIIGIIFIVLMPLIGLFFCCCRCCGNCGGKMYQKQTKSTNCKRRTLAFFLLLITIIILAGNICTYVSNEKATTSVKNSATLLNQTIDNLNAFLSTIPQQINGVINSSQIPVHNVSTNVGNLGSILGGVLLTRFGQTIYPALNSVIQRVQDINDTATNLAIANQTSYNLHHMQDILKRNLSSIQTAINTTINNPNCTNCKSVQVDVDGLVIDANYQEVPGLSNLTEKVNNIASRNLGDFVQQGIQEFNKTPEMITSQTKDLVEGVQKELVSITGQIQNITYQIPLTSSMDSIIRELDNAKDTVNKHIPTVIEINYYRWIAGIVLCSVILLIVVCNCLGLVLGPAGLRSSVDPVKRSCASNCGGEFFMVGVGFSFIFSWLFMILVLIMFLVGGNSYTLICKPWRSQELFKFIDSSGLLSKLDLPGKLGLKNTTLNISNIYSDCQRNDPLWSTLNLGSAIDLDSMLNISKYMSDITSQFDNANINISNIVLLKDDGKKILSDFVNSGIDRLNLTTLSQQTMKNFTKTDLLLLADKLQSLSINQSNPEIQTRLNERMSDLRSLDKWIKNNMGPDVQRLKNSTSYLENNLPNMGKRFNETIRQEEDAQNMLNNNNQGIVKNITFYILND